MTHFEDETLALLLISTWELYTGRTLRNAPAVELTEQELIDFWGDDAASAPPPPASPAASPGDDDGEVSIQALLTLTLSALIATITCGLTLATGATWPTALLTTGGAASGAMGLIPRLIDHTRE